MPSIVFFIRMTFHYVTKLTLSTKISFEQAIFNSPVSSVGRAEDFEVEGPGFDSRRGQFGEALFRISKCFFFIIGDKNSLSLGPWQAL